MKFISLMKAEARKQEIIDTLNEEIRKFTQSYKNYDFYLQVPDEAHLVVSMDSSKDYCEEIHNNLCDKFDVELQYVTWAQQQNPNKYTKTIELIYTPKHHYINTLKWDDISLKTGITFD